MITLSIHQPLVFLDIDTQRDFLEPTGALFVPGSTDIVPNLARLTSFATERNIPVIATACAHTADSAEFADFSPHCLLGTVGQDRVEETACPASMILPIAERLTPHEALPIHLTIHKDTYDVFERTGIDAIIDRYAEHGPAFVVYGVATDYCVKAVVDGLIQRGHSVILVVDAIRAVFSENEPAILTDFAARGVLLTLTETILKTI